MDGNGSDVMEERRARSFPDVRGQDMVREGGGLAQGQYDPGLCVYDILAASKQTHDGGSAWRNFDKTMKVKGSSAEAEMAAAGVELFRAFVQGERNQQWVVSPLQAPLLIAVVCTRSQAIEALQSPDLLNLLVERGAAEESVKLVVLEQLQKLLESPEDLDMVGQIVQLFGAPVGAKLRYMRTASKRGGGGSGNIDTVLVFAAIDLVMMAKKCGYKTAQKIVWQIFKDYYNIDLDEVDKLVNEEANPLIIHQVRFSTGERGGSETIALDVQGAAELLCLIPGSDFSANLRRRAVDTLLRVEGGDESLIDRIRANRKFQEYLAEHDPQHPLRAVGEHAERRQAEEAASEAQRRAEMDLALSHRKRMLDAEYEERLLELAAKKRRLEVEGAADLVRIEEAAEATRRLHAIEHQRALTTQHEASRRERALTITANASALRSFTGRDLSPRTRRFAEDQMRTGIVGPEQVDVTLGEPVYLTSVLEAELHLKPWAASERAKQFGKKVKPVVHRMFPDYAIETTQRVVGGHVRDQNLYYKAHMPAVQEALTDYRRDMKPIEDNELTEQGLRLRRQSSSFLGRFFVPRSSAN